MNTIEQILAQVPVTEGFVSLHLIETSTGQVLACLLGSEADRAGVPPPAAVAATLTDVVQLVGSMVTLNGLTEDLEDLVVTLTDHHYLVRVMPGVVGVEGLLLLTLERSRANLALARHLLLSFEAQLVA